jgi:RNA polymerase sigma-70 factor (sigma-E family)
VTEGVISLAGSTEWGRFDGAGIDGEVTALFAREGRQLLGMISAYTGDPDLAEELVQEAFIRLHRSWHRVKEPDAAASYLRSIAFNLARSHFRRTRLLRVLPTERLTHGQSAEESAVLSEDRREVAVALRSLPPRQRECLILRYWAGLSDSEIASTVGISRNSVKTHLRRALAAVESMLGGWQ